jgi:hypothetical protein
VIHSVLTGSVTPMVLNAGDGGEVGVGEMCPNHGSLKNGQGTPAAAREVVRGRRPLRRRRPTRPPPPPLGLGEEVGTSEEVGPGAP